MGSSVKFEGCNFTFKAPEGQEDRVKDLHCFTNGHHNVLAVELSEAEREEFLRTGLIYVSVLSGQNFFPIFVGTETTARECVEQDGGALWPSTDDIAQQKILREVHKVLGADKARRDAIRADPQRFNVACVEIKRLLFNSVKTKAIEPVLKQYLEHVK